MPDCFLAVLTHGKGVVFWQPHVGSPKPPAPPTTSVYSQFVWRTAHRACTETLWGLDFLLSSRSALIVLKLLLPPKALEKMLFSV